MAEDDKRSLLSITSTAESPLTAVRLTANETISEPVMPAARFLP